METAHAGPGNLEVMVNSGRVPTTPQAQSPTQYAITFSPTDDRPHVIDVRFNGEHVPGESNVPSPSNSANNNKDRSLYNLAGHLALVVSCRYLL